VYRKSKSEAAYRPACFRASFICVMHMVGWQAASRASSLLQKSKGRPVYIHAFHHSSGRALARLQLLILIHPPPREAEWRRSSGGQAHSAVRRSRTHREEVEAKPTGGDAPG
jgi:hypothetical protein